MRVLQTLSFISALFFINSFSLFCLAEDEDVINENPLTATLQINPSTLAPGSQAQIVINLNLADTYHAYLDRFQLSWSGKEAVKISKPEIGPAVEFKDAFSGEMKKGIEKSGTLKATMELPSNFAVGSQLANLQLTYQACTEKHCLFPKKIPLTYKLVVKNDVGSADVSTAGTVKSSGFFASLASAFKGELSFKQAVAQGMFFSFLFVFLAGVLTSLTPCVYPMIPITMAVIGAIDRRQMTDRRKTQDGRSESDRRADEEAEIRARKQARIKSVSLSIVYVLGIALTFSSLGVIAALTGSLFGSALSNPLIVGFLATIFVLLGLSMYGLFEIQAPAFIRNKLGTQKNTGYLGALFAGLISGVVAGPCVGPVLIGVLTHVGEKQDAIYGFFLLFTYSIGMGLLFIAIGTSSSLLSKMPKAGGWMDGVKFIFGTMMIVMAIYYIAPLASDRLFFALVAIALILISSSYGAFSTNETLTAFGRLRKGVMLTAFVLGIAFMLKAIVGQTNLVSNGPVGGEAAHSEKLPWQPYSEKLIADARNGKKPIIVDFFADWCVACKELEMVTFSDQKVKSLAKDYILLRFDATEESAELAELKKKYGVLGLPTVLFINPDGEVQSHLTLTGFEEGDAFSERMKKNL